MAAPGQGGSQSLSTANLNDQQTQLILQQMQQGHTNNTVTATLTANATSTIVQAVTCSQYSGIFPSPTTADAALEVATMWFTPTAGQFTVHHSSQAAADRSFVFALIG